VNQELPILGLVLTIYTLLIQVRSGVKFRVLARDVVEQRLRPISPCFHYFFIGNRSISPWLSWLETNLRQGLGQGKCFLFRGVVEIRISHL
jgi:hypothetical protein